MAFPLGQTAIVPPAGPGIPEGATSRRLNLRWRIVLAASTGFLILAVVVAATLVSALRVRQSLDDLSRLHLAAETFRSVNNTLLRMESSQRGFLLTGDSAWLAPYDTSMQALERRMDSLHRVQQGFPADSDRFQALDSLINVRITQMNTTLARYTPGNPTLAIADLRRNVTVGTADSVRQILRTLNQREEVQRLRVKEVSTRAAGDQVLAELGSGAVAVLLLLFGLRQIFADLDAREQAESSLRRSERFLDSIIDLLPLMVVVKDAGELRIIRFNRTAEQLAGLARADVLGRTDFDLFPRPWAEGSTTLDRAVLGSDGVRDVPEETLIAPNGSVRTLHTRKVAIRDDAGRPAFLLAVSEDITERKRAEAEIVRTRENAEAANRAKSDFLAKMSHELRTPLNSIIGFSQLLEEQSFGPLNDRQARYVSNVLTSGRQLLDLINDVLDLSKVEAGRMELSLADVPLGPMLQESLALVEPVAAAANLRLLLDVDAGLPTLLVDVSRFRQILYNLLANAIKFTRPGGTVTVRAAPSPNHARDGTAMTRVSVIDTGIGIRPGDLERIFREFEQVDGDTDRAAKGTGLGLALARRLTELHGGALWAESEFGLGSSFHIDVPVAAASETRANTAPAHLDMIAAGAVSPSTGRLVLVVEDDLGVAELMQHYLRSAGYRVAHVANGREVMERVADLRPDAITMDVVLPGRDGIATLRVLKADPRTAAIPVVVVSVVDERVRGLALGAFDWLLKPVQREALVASVQRSVATATAQHPVVLAVDDDPGAPDLITTVLEGAGCRVEGTTDPVKGLRLAATIEPAAIILDLGMPAMSGFEVVTQLRADPVTRDTPIIIFSGRELSVAELRRLEHDVSRVLAKPDASELVDELRRLGLASTP